MWSSSTISRYCLCLPVVQGSLVLTVLEHLLRLALQLPYPLARHLQLAAELGQRRRLPMVETVAAYQDVPIARGKLSYTLPKPDAF